MVKLNSTIACAKLNSLMTEQAMNLLRELPSVDRLLNHPRCEALLARSNREYFIQKCRDALDQSRAEIRQGKSIGGALKDEAIVARVEAKIALESQPGLSRVVNATG